MWLKLLASLCWTVGLTDWETRNKVSYFSTHSWPVQNFTSTANTSSNAKVTTVELSWHVLSKWKGQYKLFSTKNQTLQLYQLVPLIITRLDSRGAFLLVWPPQLDNTDKFLNITICSNSFMENISFRRFNLNILFMINCLKYMNLTELRLHSISGLQIYPTQCMWNMHECTFLALHLKVVLLQGHPHSLQTPG